MICEQEEWRTKNDNKGSRAVTPKPGFVRGQHITNYHKVSQNSQKHKAKLALNQFNFKYAFMKLQEQRQMLVNQSIETSERLGMTGLERRKSL